MHEYLVIQTNIIDSYKIEEKLLIINRKIMNHNKTYSKFWEKINYVLGENSHS